MTFEQVYQAAELARRIQDIDRLILLVALEATEVRAEIRPSMEEDWEPVRTDKAEILRMLKNERAGMVTLLGNFGIYLTQPDAVMPSPATEEV
jgi:hypothetical protein